MGEVSAVLRNTRMAISLFFRWGEHATFAADIAKYFGVWKMVISVEGGLLAALANWSETVSPFWKVMSGLAGGTLTLVTINVVWSLINKWRSSRHKGLTVKPARSDAVGHGRRISLLELLSKATEKGWIFNRETLQTFMQAFRQAASEERVVIWGIDLKKGRDLISASSLYVAKKIAASYFTGHWIEAHQGWIHNENRYVRTSLPSGGNDRNFYSDLHVERERALSWLDSVQNDHAV